MPISISRALARHASVCALVCSAALLITTPAFADDKKIEFYIPAEDTAKALNAFSSQSGIQILFPYDAAAETSAPALKGSFTAQDGLQQILAGSHLERVGQSGNTITLRAVPSPAGAGTSLQTSDVIVTGTHIRGANPTSPVHAVTRTDIDQSGYTQLGDLVRSLPESFSGGQNPSVFNATAGGVQNNNLTNGSTVNLRGLGTDATLVLVNGHRLSGDGYFQGSDISGIPLGAIQRVEIVGDGASAIYGSDAVAGVANFVLRRRFQGTEIGANVSGTSEGGASQRSYNALTGFSGAHHYALLSLEYAKQDPLYAKDRERLAGMPANNTMAQGQTRNSVFLSAGIDITPRVSMTLDALYSDRRSRGVFQTSLTGAQQTTLIDTPATSVALGVDIGLVRDWKLRLSGVASQSQNQSLYASSVTAPYSKSSRGNATSYFEVTADGTLFHLPSGDVKAAFGGGYRRETYRVNRPGSSSYLHPSRHIAYAYAETIAPLVTPSPARVGLEELEISLSARTENYSDFGSSTNPRIGLRYVPFSDLTVRATWGKSFKAPSFDQMDSGAYVFLYPAKSLGYVGAGTTLLAMGGNPALQPERSTSWTLGAAYSPAAIPSLKFGVTYFDIDYVDRIVQPVTVLQAFFSDPHNATFIEPNPSAAAQSTLIANANYFYNFSGGAYDQANTVAILRNAYMNAAAQQVKGLDVSYRQSFSIKNGRLDAFANATWLNLDQKTIPLMPTVTLSGTIYHPPKLKVRTGLSWNGGGLSATGLVNFVGKSVDTIVNPNAPVASWTTVDANVGYTFAASEGWQKGVRVSVSATNLFDRKAPFVLGTAKSMPGLYFDSTNANVLGRVVNLSLSKSW